MKIIHCADLHLDSTIGGLTTEKSRLRKEEILHTFERLCEYATLNKVSVVLICGDLFDSDKITLKTKERIFAAIKKCNNTEFLYLSGNHDEKNKFLSLENLPTNIKFFTNDWTYFNYNNITIAGAIIENNDFSILARSLNLSENSINIVALHGEIVGYVSNAKAELISIPQLKDKNINYLALGHYHSYTEGKIDNRGKFVYSGCLDGRGFDEIGEKGFVEIEINEVGKLTNKFIPFASRSFFVENYNVENETNFFEAIDNILNILKNKYQQSSLIKLVLVGEHSADFNIDLYAINEKLKDHFFFVKVYDKTQLKIKLEDFEFDKSIKGEFVRTVLSSKLTEEDKKKVILLGLRTLKGEDV